MGSIVTFYSYKGGVGRTMAVANIAILLARRGLRILVVDWDLEAPGLHRYFAEFIADSRKGVLEFLVDAGEHPDAPPDWRSYTSSVTVDADTTFELMPAGRFDDDYERRVLQLNWSNFFEKQRGGAVLELLRQQWTQAFDVTLIDSRTGITDSGGVCTVQMPDILVPVFAANRQSLDGAKKVALRAQQARQDLAYDRIRLLVFPLPSRFDSRTEYREAQHWLKVFAEELKSFYSDWLPKDVSPYQMLERTKLPYVPFFSFGEKLPVLTEGTTDPESLPFAYQTAATLIAHDFKDAQQILISPSPGGSSADLTSPLPKVEWTRRIDQAIQIAGFEAKPSFALSVAPTRGIDLPDLIESQHHQLVQLIERPPTLRQSGFDINAGGPAKLASRGRVRRTLHEGYKLLELWRDGCLVFVADGAGFLCRDIHDQQRVPLRINTLVLAESTVLFCELARKLYMQSMRQPRTVQYLIEFRNLTVNGKNPILLPRELSALPWPGDEPHQAEYGGERFTMEADIETDPAVTAFQLISEVYSWFNIEHDQIPYSAEKDGVRRIDTERIHSLRG